MLLGVRPMAHRTSTKPDRDKGTRILCMRNRITEGSIDVTPESPLGTPTSPFEGGKAFKRGSREGSISGARIYIHFVLSIISTFFP